MDYDTVMLEMQDAMEKAVAHTLHEFSTLHTGKASPSMVESLPIEVERYGSTMQLRELAAITTPDPRCIVVTPWDKSTLKSIERGIQAANLGFNPVVQGNLVRIPIPELSGDRRRDLAKVANRQAEDGRIAVRHARHDAIEAFRKMEKEKEISEDDLHRFEKEVQQETDKAIARINDALETKEKELLTV